MIVPISTPGDPRVADYVDVKERDLVSRRGLFLAEGTEVVRTMVFRSRFNLRSIFLSEKRVEAVRDVIAHASSEVPVYVAPQEIMDRVVGFPIHRGCLAVGCLGDPISPLDVLPRARTVVVLEGISNHDNVGGIFRNALAFGVDAVLLDRRTADPLYRKAIRVSMGATLRVPFLELPSIQHLRDDGFSCIALTPSGDDAIDAIDWPARVALVVGTEGRGLAEATMASCDRRARIPMVDGVDSLNVAAACGIALFERRRLCIR